MTKRGKTRPQPSAPAFVDEPLPGLSGGPEDQVQPAAEEDLEKARRLAVLRLRRSKGEAEIAARRMAEAVAAARELGLSWDAIGASTGTQGETVRRRYG